MAAARDPPRGEVDANLRQRLPFPRWGDRRIPRRGSVDRNVRESFCKLREWCNFGMAMDDSVRKVVKVELQRMILEPFEQILNNLHQQLESKMNEKLEPVIPQFLNQTDNIIRWQTNGVIAHTCQLPRLYASYELESDEHRCSDLQDGSQREPFAGNGISEDELIVADDWKTQSDDDSCSSNKTCGRYAAMFV
ncbi:hypothetical protein OPV22_014725 [Ensete ventricosum]|uniref:Dynamin stalk domain-containing protein n=1 Tax=Ensete ventricosum TaxID=4639 RepID=A0AAV8R3W1_ENSVE|nr:hypothetical protein OPV22_014725 [Ensete ventricosum]